MSKEHMAVSKLLTTAVVVLGVLYVVWPRCMCGYPIGFPHGDAALAQLTKAQQDLSTICSAIRLYEERFRPLSGTELTALVGQTMQELPKDPWGAPYLLDASLGLVWSYGADARPGGTDADQDTVATYKPPLRLRRVEYLGPFGPPRKGDGLRLTFTKAFDRSGLSSEAIATAVVVRSGAASAGGSPSPTATLEQLWPGAWRPAARDKSSSPEVLDLECQRNLDGPSVSPEVRFDLAANQRALAACVDAGSAIRKFWPSPRSPTTAAISKPEMKSWFPFARERVPLERIDSAPAGFDESFALPCEGGPGLQFQQPVDDSAALTPVRPVEPR